LKNLFIKGENGESFDDFPNGGAFLDQENEYDIKANSDENDSSV
jgi:hypothetical protein